MLLSAVVLITALSFSKGIDRRHANESGEIVS